MHSSAAERRAIPKTWDFEIIFILLSPLSFGDFQRLKARRTPTEFVSNVYADPVWIEILDARLQPVEIVHQVHHIYKKTCAPVRKVRLAHAFLLLRQGLTNHGPAGNVSR
jgi:hypothetical protein